MKSIQTWMRETQHRFTDDRNIQMYCLFAPSVNLHVLDHRSLTKCPNTEKYKGWENLKKKKHLKDTSQGSALGHPGTRRACDATLHLLRVKLNVTNLSSLGQTDGHSSVSTSDPADAVSSQHSPTSERKRRLLESTGLGLGDPFIKREPTPMQL